MSAPRLMPLDRPDVPPLSISARLRGQLVYFMTPPGTAGLPELRENEFWFRPRRGGRMARRGRDLPGVAARLGERHGGRAERRAGGPARLAPEARHPARALEE